MLTVIKVRFICYLLWLWTWRSLYETAADTWGTRRLWRDEPATQCSGCTWRDWCRAGLWQTRTCTGPPQSWRTPSAIGSELQKQTFESLRANYSFRKGFIFSLESRTQKYNHQNNYKIGLPSLRFGQELKRSNKVFFWGLLTSKQDEMVITRGMILTTTLFFSIHLDSPLQYFLIRDIVFKVVQCRLLYVKHYTIWMRSQECSTFFNKNVQQAKKPIKFKFIQYWVKDYLWTVKLTLRNKHRPTYAENLLQIFWILYILIVYYKSTQLTSKSTYFTLLPILSYLKV